MLKILFLLEMLLNHWIISYKNILFGEIYTLEDENTILSQNNEIHLPTDATSYATRMEFSATLLHKPQNS
jgi:hypothetical protein